MERDHGCDNIKFILIFCVVFGHLLEFCQVSGGGYIYRLIYLFHMPLFIFLSGYFSKRTVATRKILTQLLTYVVFQILYLAFVRLVLGQGIAVQFTTPYWIMWYALATLFYTLLIPLYHVDTTLKRIAAVIVTMVLALLVGFEDTVGYYMSLSRFFVFQPFFLMGYYCRQEEPNLRRFFAPRAKQKTLIRVLTVPVALATVGLMFVPRITADMMYGSYPYSVLNYGVAVRAVLMIAAVVWIAFFMLAVKPLVAREIPVLSMIGANTLSIYLLHGFAVKLAQAKFPELMHSYAAVVLFTAGCLVVFGNPVVSSLVQLKFRRWRKKSEVTK